MKLWPFTRKPEPLRAIVATRSESAKVAAKKRETTEALRRVVTEQRLLEAGKQAVRS